MAKPKIRFKGYQDDWEQRKAIDIADYLKGNGYSKGDLTDAGTPIILYGRLYTKYQFAISEVDTFAVPRNGAVYSQGNEVIVPASGETAEDIARASAVEKSGVLLGGDLNILRPFDFINPLFLALAISNGEPQKELAKKAQGKSVVHIHNTDIQEVTIAYPSRTEQDRIVSVFCNLDHLITLHQRKCEETKKLKKFMLQKMFPQNGSLVPEIRFDVFTDDWEQRKLEDLCELITKQTGFDYAASIKPALITDRKDDTYSFIQNKDFCGNDINMNTDFYIPVEVAERFPKILLDKPSVLISISGRIGNVGFYKLQEKAFIGGAVGICKLRDAEEGEFIIQELESEYGQKYFKSLIKASSHANITVEDIRNIELQFPKEEQEKRKISDIMSNLDHLITLHQQKCDDLKNLKKYMLQNMFI